MRFRNYDNLPRLFEYLGSMLPVMANACSIMLEIVMSSGCIYACAVGGDCLEVDHVRRFQTSARREQEM